MGDIQVGQQAIDFCLSDANQKQFCLKDQLGKWVVLYFYPKDNTSGCTLEAVNFSNEIEKFSQLNSIVVGVSPDSSKSHCHFRDKHDLKVILLSDGSHRILEKYGVWVLKKMYGREYYGVQRSTFLIDPKGQVTNIWRKVKVAGHIEEVKETLLEQQAR